MNNDKQLTIIDQRDVTFYEDVLTAVKLDNGDIFVSVRAVCDALDIDHRAQYRRIRRQRTLDKGFMVVKMTTIKGERDTNVLRVDLLPLFLTGIGTRSIKDDRTRQKLETFQDNAARVLWEAFQNGELSADHTFDELLQQGGEAVEAYQLLQGMLKLAKNQIVIQAQVREHATRIEAIEAELNDSDRFLTQSQAVQISQGVKAIALELGKRSGRNEFGGVYGELYRRFEVTSYKQIPANKFQAAMTYLRDWWQALTDLNEIPF
jgi:hypothetical protein